MHKLLERQVKKYLPKHIHVEDVSDLLNAVTESYIHYDNSRERQERAIYISSSELERGNEKLMADAKEQKVILSKLKLIMEQLQPIANSNSAHQIKNSNIELIEEISRVVENQKNHESEVSQLLASLLVANKELDSFAHIISHDLKAPLRGISSVVTWLSEDYNHKFDPTGQEQILLLKERIKKMYALIDGVLALSKIGKSSVEISEINLMTFLNNEVIPLLDIPDHIEIVMSDLPIISSDENLVKQLFLNILDNAIKFCDKPQSLIEIGCSDKKSNWEFWIRDNGIGIPERFHDKIFQIFQTLDQSKSSTGIGLAHVKKMIESIDGKIWVESVPSKGSTFYFTWQK